PPCSPPLPPPGGRWRTTRGLLAKLVYPELSDHRLERLKRTYPHHVPRRLRLEDRRLLGEGVDPLALLGGRLPFHRDAHQAGHLEDAREIGRASCRERV